MITDLLAPPQGTGQKNCAVARLIHVSNLHTKFGWISSNGFGGDSVTDRQGEGGLKCILLAPNLRPRSYCC